MAAPQSDSRGRSVLCALAVLLLLAGCATLQPPVEVTEVPPPPIEVVDPPPELVDTPPLVEAAPAPEPAPPPAPEPVERHVAVVLSDDIPMFSAVADQLRGRLPPGEYTVHNLEGHPANSARVLEEIRSADPDQVVSVGLLAAEVTLELDVPMVFCYVFNYADHELLSPRSKGVNLLPPFRMQLDAWAELSPGLSRIGVMTGPNQDLLLEEIQQASEEKGIELHARTVHSDQEALYVFKRLTPEIEGLWLLPDNRILSPRAVREIMSYGARHRVQIVVFGSGLLELGAFMAITSLPADVADQVAARLTDVTDDGLPAGPAMAPLTRMDVEVNRDVARHLGVVPAERSVRSSQSR